MIKNLRIVNICMGFLLVFGYQGTSMESVGKCILGQQKVVISEVKPFLDGIEQAEDYLYIGAYKLHNNLLPNPNIIRSIEKSKEKEGLKGNIFIVLENNLTPEEVTEENDNVKAGDSLDYYGKLGIHVVPSSPTFQATHYKILVTSKYAFVGTTNFGKELAVGKESESSTEFEVGDTITRDFSFILTNPILIEELQQVVKDDKAGRKSNLQDFHINEIKEGESRLTWGPEQHRVHLRQLIEKSMKSIEIYQQALQDEELTDCLVEAVKRGVAVSILMSEFPFGTKHGNKSKKYQDTILDAKSDEQGRAEVRLTGQLIKQGNLIGKRLHIHAKVMIIDGDVPQAAVMYLGSANFYTPALDKDRNVGVITRDPTYITPVRTQFIQDWQAHTP